MSTNQTDISHLVLEVSTKHTHGACLMTRLSSEVDFSTSEIRAINWCYISKGIFFISDISNNQGTHIQKSVTDNVTKFNLIHKFNWPRKIHTTTAEWKTRRKVIRTLYDESKKNLHTPLGKWSLDNNKYIRPHK